jgi:cobalt-zinc-cadmium efflux system outer membrane protein
MAHAFRHLSAERHGRLLALTVVAVASMTVGRARAEGLGQATPPIGPPPGPSTPRQVAPEALTLAAAEARALTSNPTLVAARLQRPVDEAGVAVARERPNPDVSFNATRQTPRDLVALNVPIELGGKRTRRVELAEATVASGEADLSQTIAQVQNSVRRAYYQAVAAQAKVTLTADAQRLAQRARDAAQARFTAGEVPQSDVTQADLDLADAEDDTTDAGGEAVATRAELNALLGEPAATPIVFAEDLSATPVPSLTDALAEATQTNTELKALDRHIAEQAARVNVARSQRIPDFSAGAGLTFNAEPDFGLGWSVTFDMTVPLFTSHRAGVTVETAELAHLHAARDARALAIAGDVEAAYARLDSARARLERLQTRSLPLGSQVEQMAQRAYAAGEKGLTDLLQALQQVRDIRLKALQSGLDFQLALADLEQAIGAPIR